MSQYCRSDRPALIAAAAALFVLAAGCREGEPDAGLYAESRSGDSSGALVVLRISDTEYTRADFDKYVRGVTGDSDMKLEASSLSRLFDDFVDQKILLRDAKDQGVILTDEEKQALLDKWNKNNPAAGGGGLSVAGSQDLFFENMLIEKYIGRIVKDITVSDDEVGRYYQSNASEFQQTLRVQLSQILLKTKEKAAEILERLKFATEEEFCGLARQISAGPEASAGGKMGVFKAGELPRDMGKVVFSLKEGEVSRVVESDYGFHIFRADKFLGAEHIPREKAADSIRLKIMEEKANKAKNEHLRQLKEGLDWNSYPERLPFSYQKDKT